MDYEAASCEVIGGKHDGEVVAFYMPTPEP